MMRDEYFVQQVPEVFKECCSRIENESILAFPKNYQENFIQIAAKKFPTEFISFAAKHKELFECNVKDGNFDKCFETAKEAIDEYESSNDNFNSTFEKNLFSIKEDDLPEPLIVLKNDVTGQLKKSKSAIKKLKKDIEVLEDLVKQDYLTKLLNRKTFDEDIKSFIDNEYENGYLIVLDIDDFKNVNDTYGHSIGDKTLIFLSEVLKSEFRNDGVYRYGGEEFAILVEGIPLDSLLQRVESLMNKIRKSCLTHKGYKIKLTISAGVTKLRADDTSESFFDRADTMLLNAKTSGKDKLEFI